MALRRFPKLDLFHSSHFMSLDLLRRKTWIMIYSNMNVAAWNRQILMTISTPRSAPTLEFLPIWTTSRWPTQSDLMNIVFRRSLRLSPTISLFVRICIRRSDTQTMSVSEFLANQFYCRRMFCWTRMARTIVFIILFLHRFSM